MVSMHGLNSMVQFINLKKYASRYHFSEILSGLLSIINMDYLGLITANPAPAESIKAIHEDPRFAAFKPSTHLTVDFSLLIVLQSKF
jgi:hypothetical protein